MAVPETSVDLDVAARLRTSVTRLNRRLRQQSLSGLSASQASTLAMVQQLGSPTLGELARAEQIQPPTMTRLVATMEDADLLARSVDDKDRRVARVTLTAKGRRELQRIRTSKTAFLVDRLSALSPQDQARAAELVELLERLGGDR